MRREKTIENAI